MASTIAALVVGRLFDVGVKRGVPATTLARIVGRPRSALTDDKRIAIDRVFECFAACLKHTDDPAFPLQVARAVTPEDYSVIGFALMTSSSASEMFDRLVRYGHLITDSGSWRMKTDARGVEVDWVRPGTLTLGHRAANECAIAELVGGLRRGYGSSLPLERVFFRHAAPRNTREHAATFGVPIQWGSRKDGLLLGCEFLSLRPLSENSAMSRYFEKVLEARANVERTCEGRVRRALALALSSGTPQAEDIAAELGMSERSLRRALANEKTSYRALLDDLRKTTALDMLRTRRSATEVAFLLGFSETSALSRAFRRWHGRSIRSMSKATQRA